MSDPSVFAEKVLVEVQVIDVALDYLREDPWGNALPEQDFRLHAVTPGGGAVTFHAGATAADVFAYWKREGWLP